MSDKEDIPQQNHGCCDMPEVWQGRTFSKSDNFNMQLRSHYGDPARINQMKLDMMAGMINEFIKHFPLPAIDREIYDKLIIKTKEDKMSDEKLTVNDPEASKENCLCATSCDDEVKTAKIVCATDMIRDDRDLCPFFIWIPHPTKGIEKFEKRTAPIVYVMFFFNRDSREITVPAIVDLIAIPNSMTEGEYATISSEKDERYAKAKVLAHTINKIGKLHCNWTQKIDPNTYEYTEIPIVCNAETLACTYSQTHRPTGYGHINFGIAEVPKTL